MALYKCAVATMIVALVCTVGVSAMDDGTDYSWADEEGVGGDSTATGIFLKDAVKTGAVCLDGTAPVYYFLAGRHCVGPSVPLAPTLIFAHNVRWQVPAMALTSGTFITRVVAGVRAMRYARAMICTQCIRLVLRFCMPSVTMARRRTASNAR